MAAKAKVFTIGSDDVDKVKIGLNQPLVFIGGPCAIESRDHAFMMAEKIMEICRRVDIKWIYKSCYDKDCRSSPKSFHGLGLDHGLQIVVSRTPSREGVGSHTGKTGGRIRTGYTTKTRRGPCRRSPRCV